MYRDDGEEQKKEKERKEAAKAEGHLGCLGEWGGHRKASGVLVTPA